MEGKEYALEEGEADETKLVERAWDGWQESFVAGDLKGEE